MKFEVINQANKVVMNTEQISRIPNDARLKLMNIAGYKFKMNGKPISLIRLKEFLIKNGRGE